MGINIKRKGLIRGFLSLLRLKLVVPLLRSKKPPEFTARGAMIGMGWAMTPLVGIQMYMVFLTWLFTRRFFKWDFSLPIGLAWTWVTNVFTVPPFYYAFYVTGKIMTGEFAERTTYAKFVGLLKNTLNEDGLAEALKTSLDILIKDWGASMMLGSIPWIIGGGWLAYRWTLVIVRKRDIRRQKKLEMKAEAAQKALRDQKQETL